MRGPTGLIVPAAAHGHHIRELHSLGLFLAFDRGEDAPLITGILGDVFETPPVTRG